MVHVPDRTAAFGVGSGSGTPVDPSVITPYTDFGLYGMLTLAIIPSTGQQYALIRGLYSYPGQAYNIYYIVSLTNSSNPLYPHSLMFCSDSLISYEPFDMIYDSITHSFYVIGEIQQPGIPAPGIIRVDQHGMTTLVWKGKRGGSIPGFGLMVLSNGIYYIDDDEGDASLCKVDMTTGKLTTLETSVWNVGATMVANPDQGYFYMLDTQQNYTLTVVRVDPTGKELAKFVVPPNIASCNRVGPLCPLTIYNNTLYIGTSGITMMSESGIFTNLLVDTYFTFLPDRLVWESMTEQLLVIRSWKPVVSITSAQHVQLYYNMTQRLLTGIAVNSMGMVLVTNGASETDNSLFRVQDDILFGLSTSHIELGVAIIPDPISSDVFVLSRARSDTYTSLYRVSVKDQISEHLIANISTTILGINHGGCVDMIHNPKTNGFYLLCDQGIIMTLDETGTVTNKCTIPGSVDQVIAITMDPIRHVLYVAMQPALYMITPDSPNNSSTCTGSLLLSDLYYMGGVYYDSITNHLITSMTPMWEKMNQLVIYDTMNFTAQPTIMESTLLMAPQSMTRLDKETLLVVNQAGQNILKVAF